MRSTRDKNGFTLVELLIALAITGVLLAAVAVAFNASIINYRENENLFKMVNNARRTLFQITTQVRTADWVDPNSPSNECALTTADGNDVTYRYNDSEDKLYLDTASGSYALCDNIVAMTFVKRTATEDATVYVKSVQTSITVTNGTAQRTVSAAAVVRRNLRL